MVPTARLRSGPDWNLTAPLPQHIERQRLRPFLPPGPNHRSARNPLEVVGLTRLMEQSVGRPDVTIALVDGPVAIGHPDLASARIQEVPRSLLGACARASSAACMHGTFVAGMLSARRGSSAPAICPGCTLLVRPVFAEAANDKRLPSASPEELADAVIDAVEAGACIVNVSAALAQASERDEWALRTAFKHALSRGTIVVAAAGNHGTIGGSILARHVGVVPVVASDTYGRPLSWSVLGNSIGRRGLSSPGDGVMSLGTEGMPLILSGTSAAAPFVTGTIALLWSEFPAATATQIRRAVTEGNVRRRNTVVPPLLDAWGAYRTLAGR
jgi:subtilisin family serine protease